MDEGLEPAHNLVADLPFMVLDLPVLNLAIQDQILFAKVGLAEVDEVEGEKLVEVGEGEFHALGGLGFDSDLEDDEFSGEEGFLELPPILLLFGIGHLDVSFDALDGRVGE